MNISKEAGDLIQDIKMPSFSWRNLINFEPLINFFKVALGILVILIIILIYWKVILILINKKRFWKQEVSYRNTNDIKKESENLKKEISDIKQTLSEIKLKLSTEKKPKEDSSIKENQKKQDKKNKKTKK